MATCEALAHARCDIIAGSFAVMRRGDRCEWERHEWCFDFNEVSYREGWELPSTDFGLCESSPGYCHAESLFKSLKRGTDYARNCGVNHPSWRVAIKAERRL